MPRKERRPITRRKDSDATRERQNLRSELVQWIAEQLCGVNGKRETLDAIRVRIEQFKGEFDANRSEPPKQIRDKLLTLKSALSGAAKAVRGPAGSRQLL
jgi:hypothetical protein